MVFYLDEYEHAGKMYSPFEYYCLVKSQFTEETQVILLRDKILQEKQRAKEIMDNEKDPKRKERMKALYDSRDYAFDYQFFGKKPQYF
jgi:flagellin-specific chaperone FliS